MATFCNIFHQLNLTIINYLANYLAVFINFYSDYFVILNNYNSML